MSKWEKHGLIFDPIHEHKKFNYFCSHAAVPCALPIDNRFIKIFFSGRDFENRSITYSIIVDSKNNFKISEFNSCPIIYPGKLGTFDDSGAMATWVLRYRNKIYLYYIGWNLGTTVPFRNSIGLAISEDMENFEKVAEYPILDRGKNDEYFTASCCVLPYDSNSLIMYYLSCIGWEKLTDTGKLRHKYHIKIATSADGIKWKRLNKIAITFKDDSEYAISRPSVLRDADKWKMWYSYRGDFYKIGYAESSDGINWIRKDNHLGIEPSIEGWDSKMVEYPCIFEHANNINMLYNGNDYGKTGIGLAKLL